MADYMENLIETIDLNQDGPLYRIIYKSLRKAIIEGKVPVGERINEKIYAQELNVSRTPVRVALQRLEDEGIVKHLPNHGIIVTRITKKDVEEIYKIRVALDILASGNAAKMMTDVEKESVENLLKRTKEADEAGFVEEVIQLSKEFNHRIYELADMPHLKMIQKKLHDYLIRFRDVSLMSDKRRREAVEEHQAIFDCMCSGEMKELEGVITNHLYRSKKFILLEMDEANDE